MTNRLSQIRLVILREKGNWKVSDWLEANKIAWKMLKVWKKEEKAKP